MEGEKNIENPEDPESQDPVIKEMGDVADENKQTTCAGKMLSELYRIGYRFFHCLDSDGKQHKVFFIFLVSVIQIIIFILMVTTDAKNGGTPQKLSVDVKVQFGALSFDLIKANHSEFYRVFTSIFLHASVTHLVNNLAAQILMGYSIERKFGFLVTGLIYIVSGIGGNIFSLVFERNYFFAIVGASGCVYGLVGSYISDWVKNRETIKLPITRGILVGLCIILLFVQGFIDQGQSISNFSHLGGLYTGIFPVFLLLPNFKKENWEVILFYIGLVSFLMEFIALPLILFYSIMA